MLSKKTVLSLVIILSLISPASNGQDDSDALVSDRPFFSQSPSIVPKGTFQLEIGFSKSFQEYSMSNYYRRYTQYLLPELLLRTGLSKNIEVRLSWFAFNRYYADNYYQFRSSSASSGTSDLYIGFRKKTKDGDDDQISAAVELGLTAPTGSTRNDDVLFTINFLYRISLSEHSFISGSTATYFIQPFKDHLSTQSLAFNFGLTKKIAVFFEPFIFYQVDNERLAPAYFFNSGIRYNTKSMTIIDLSFGKEVEAGYSNYTAGVGFSFIL